MPNPTPKQSFSFFVFVFFLCLPLVVPHWARAQEKVSMDFKDAEIQVFIEFISDLTEENFIVGEEVRGRITVISPVKLTKEEAYKVFESVLEVHGFTTVPREGATKIVPAVEARKKGLEVQLYRDPAKWPRDRMLTRVVPLEHASSEEVRQILTPMASEHGLLLDYTPTDTLIVTDYETNIEKILQTVKKVDVRTAETRIEVFELQHGEAPHMAQGLNDLRQARERVLGKRAPFLHAVPFERTNAIAVLMEEEIVPEIEDFISRLDHPDPEPESSVHVIRLQNAVATDLAHVLGELPVPEVRDEEALLSERVRIVADEASNSLVVTALQAEFSALMPVIEELDKPQAQVYVEAAIMEVSMDKSLDFGINWQAAGDLGSQGFIGGTVGGAVGRNIEDLAQQLDRSGASLGILSFPFTYEGETYYNLSSFVRASERDHQVDVISTPQLLTMNNSPAEVVVGQSRPFITSREVVDDREYSHIEYRDVGVTLRVTPRINEEGSVKMDIYQELSRVDQRAIELEGIEARTPVTSKRTAETRVEVRDGQTAVIAGLIQEEETRRDAGVPFLSRMPGLGWLFGQTERAEAKENLMVFLSPRVVRTEQEMQSIWSDKKYFMSGLSYGVEGRTKSLSSPMQMSPPSWDLDSLIE